MNNSHDSSETVLIECDLPEPPEKVWRALTEPDLRAAWLAPEEGAAAIDCEIISAEPHERLRCRWRDRERDETGGEERALDSIVTFELSPTPDGGTHLRLIHSDFAIVACGTFATLVDAEEQGTIIQFKRERTPPVASAVAGHSWRRAA